MNTNDKARNDGAFAGDVSGEQTPEREEILDLVDEVPLDDDSAPLEQVTQVESRIEEDEDLIELTDVVEENFSEPQIDDAALEWGTVEVLEPETKEGPEDEEVSIELTDELVPGTGYAQEQEEAIELGDLAEETEGGELSEARISIPEPDQDSLVETLGIEVSEEGREISFETPVDQGPADEGLAAIPEEARQPVADRLESEDWPELDPEELGLDQEPEPFVELAQEAPPLERAPEPVGGTVEPAVLEGLSDERLEEIITRIVKQTIEEKAERILLEAAEAAIAREIERIKQAL